MNSSGEVTDEDNILPIENVIGQIIKLYPHQHLLPSYHNLWSSMYPGLNRRTTLTLKTFKELEYDYTIGLPILYRNQLTVMTTKIQRNIHKLQP